MKNHLKKTIYTQCKLAVSCLLLLFLTTACSPEKEVRNVATGYLKALVDYRLDDAKKFGDESAIEFLDLQQEIINSWTPEELEMARKSIENTEVKIVEVSIKDTKADVVYEFVQAGQVVQSERLHLIKSDAGWKVQEFM